MKISKNLLICALLVLVMLCVVSTASAEESLDQNLTVTDTGGDIEEVVNEELSVSDSQDKLSAAGDTITVDAGGSGDYQTISAAVGAATGGETIFIKNGEYTESNTLIIGKSLNFVGESNGGVSLKLANSGKISLIESNTNGITISFKNLIFKDSESTAGSGIIRFYGNYPMDINFTDCTFSNLTNKYGLQFATTGTTNIENCKFQNIISKTSAGSTGIYYSAGGKLNIKNTIFDNPKYINSAGQNGAVIFMSNAGSTLIAENITIQNFNGPANSILRSTGTVDIKKSKFINNTVTLSSAGYVGDSLFYIGGSGKLTMEQSIIANNTVAKNVIYMGSSASTTMNYNNIYDNTFDSSYEGGFKTNNGALDADYNYWGSNDQPSTPTVNNWVIEENGVFKLNDGSELDKEIPILDDGGDEPEVEYDIYVDCYAADGGDGSKLAPFKSISEAVNAATGAETIFIKNGEYTEGSLSFKKTLNLVGESKEGVSIKSNGNIALLTTTSDVSDITLSFNNLTFKDSARTGGNGLMFFAGTVDLNFDNCNFIDLSSKYGAIQTNTAGTLTISNCLFDDVKGSVGSGTGLMYLNGGIVNIYDSIISNCKYVGTTGQMNALIQVYSASNVLNIERTTIKNTKGAAGSLIRTAGTVNIKNSNIINNTVELSSSGYSGDSLFYVTKTLNIEQSVIADNNGPKNLIYSSAAGSIVMNYNNIQNNTFLSGFKTTTGALNAEYNYWGSNDAPIDPSVTRYAIMDSEGHFTDDQGNALEKEIPLPEDEGGDEPAVLDIIYVSESGNNDHDGSMSAPVKTIDKAIELAQKGKIVILPGTYTLTETLSIDKDLNIEGRGNVLINGNVQLISNSAKLNLTNIKFNSAADTNGAVVSSTGDLNIDSCVFNVNTESGNAIYIDGGNANIANSVLLNPTGYSLVASSTPSTITANNNWWGKNDSANTNVVVASWIVMDVNLDSDRINAGDEITITAKFIKNDGSDYAGTLPEFNVTFTASNLDESVAVKNNQASVKYIVNSDDEATVTSGLSIKMPLKLYDPPEVIYVNATGGLDTNDGDEAHPVQSIEKAIELAVKGKIILLEGTYTIDNTLTVNRDLDITGVGTVVVDGNSKCILKNNANLNITNVRFTNGFDSSAVIVNNANMTLSNTLFYSNVNLNGYGASVVRNNKKLVIDNSKFYENKERYGNIYNNAGELYINNTEFYDNDMTAVTTVNTGLAVYSEGGNAVIENSKFYNNKGNFSVIYFMSKDSLSSTKINNLTIDNCTFDNNQLVRYGAIHSQKANTTIKDSTFTNNVVIKGTSSDANGAAIYVYGEKVTVESSVFKNNNADKGNDIYVYSGELDISDSVLINSNGYSIEKESSATVNANDNWWGANTPNTNVDVERWIIMTVSANDTEIETDDVITITASFDKTNSSEGVIADYAGDLPEVFDVTFTSTSGNLNEVKTVKDKKAEVTYTVVEADKKITVSSDNAQETLSIHRILDTIYVSEDGDNDNDGDRNAPVKTLEKAVELAVKGKIVILSGTYKTGDLGIISHDLNITGEGKVIIDANNDNRILYISNNSNVVLKNLVMINGYVSESSDDSGALIGSAGNLTIINCTLANSTSEKNGGAIYNAGKLTVIDSIFENNTASKNGGAIFTQSAGIGIIPSLYINSSSFRNNDAEGSSNYGGGAIYVQQASDDLLIENSIFEENTCYDYGGGAIEIAQTNAAKINNCTFINNYANSEDHKTRSNYGGGAISFKGFYDGVRETLTVTNSLFIDNSVEECGGGAIFVMYATADVKNSVLIGNGDNNGVQIYGRDADVAPAKITANDNWWGSNDNPKSSINRGTLTRWAILTITNASEIKAGETVKLTVSLTQYTTGSENGTLANPIIVERPVLIHTNIEDIEAKLENGEYTVDYVVPEGLKIISATVDSETQVLYVLTTQTSVKLDNITGMMGDKLVYTINVSTNDGTIVNTGYVELYFGDDLIATIPVVNGEANDEIFITKETGNYTITAKYIDETQEFANNESIATLKVTGIDNVVTPETFDKFFNDNGDLKEDFILDELIFKGQFNDLGIISIDKSIKVTGDNALFNNTALSIDADDVTVSNINFVADKQFADNDDALIYIGGDNAVLTNNNITYNAPDDVESHVITVDIADNVKITGNNIKYSAKSNGTVETIAVVADESNNLVFENNKLDAAIPSVDNYMSEGVLIKDSDNVSFNKNTIDVKCSNVNGTWDTILAVQLKGCDDSRVTGNSIDVTGNSYVYGLDTNFCENVTISGNDIKSTGNNYANGVQVSGESTGVVDNNNISAKAVNVTYPVYFDDWYTDSEVNLTNNNITGESDTVYGVYVEENKTTIANNKIDVSGNHVYGIVSHQTDMVIDGNDITANGKDVGSIVAQQSGVNENTTGIIVSEGSAKITNNNVVTSGKSTITALNTDAIVENNGLTSNGATADGSIKKVNSTVVSANNTAAKTKADDTAPTTPVVKITASNAKVDYGFKYRVRVTEDGKSVGAGKQVTLKIAGKTLKAKTDKNGYATFTLAVKPKAYNVIVTYNKVTQKAKVTVKNVIKAKNLKVKKSAKKVKIKVTLKTSAKKAIKGKKVILKIKGKKIKAKTNKKGVATFKIKKSILKKLKAGKKYKYQVIYGKDIVKKTLKVKK